jgi:uncharacterized protein (DUF1810 family)
MAHEHADPFDLARFVEAQAGVYPDALAELKAGRKDTHWIWFVFPQLAGLGTSAMNRRYAIGSLEEAVAYLEHPVLGPRLRECVDTVNGLQGRTARAIFGPDDVKVRSSLTLFHRAAPQEARFAEALAKYFGGEQDGRTLQLLAATFGGR